MSQLPPSDLTPQQPTPNQNLRQNVEDSTVRGGIQGAQGNGNIQIQGSGNQINLMLSLNKAKFKETKTFQEPRINESELVINSSGNWVLLQGHFFQAATVRQHPDGILTVKIPSENAQDDATIQSLRPNYWGQSQLTMFAYRNDGFLVSVAGIEAESRQDAYVWTVTLRPANIQYGGRTMEPALQGRERFYSRRDIAELRGRRILLNDPPPKPVTDYEFYNLALADDLLLETLIKGIDSPIKVENCVLQSLYPAYNDRPKLFLELARLAAIFSLKAGDVVEQVLELTLGPINQSKAYVRFRGRRRKVYSNAEPAVIEIEGNCPLE